MDQQTYRDQVPSSSSHSATSLVRVLSGRDIRVNDGNRKPHLYCRLGSCSSSNNVFLDESKCVRSEATHLTLLPSWKKGLLEVGDNEAICVRVELWDKDFETSDTLMGYINIEIDPLAKVTEQWLPLVSPRDGLVCGELCVEGKLKGIPLAKSTEQDPIATYSHIMVRVAEARNLIAKDLNGLSDPYCVIGVPSPSGEFFADSKLTKSEIKFQTLNPAWNKAIFSSYTDLQQIRVEVWDKDFDKNDDFIGYALIALDPYAEFSDKWVTLLSTNPNDSSLLGEIHVVITRKFFHKASEENKRNRMVRVFLSSTFLDMHEERERIMHYTMVELERFCYERGVSLTYIDMRWGITDEMGKNSQTILRCLQEVDNSRPYFVAMLGERYGWHQEADGKDTALTKTFELAEAFPEYSWIKDFRTSSVTELEILHGFLMHSYSIQNHVFCYSRNPSFIDTLDDSKKPRYKDSSPYAIQKMKELKQTIKNKPVVTQRDYTHPEEVGKMLLEDLKASIARDFQEIRKEDLRNQEHFNYAHQRCVSYIAREANYQEIDNAISAGDAGQYLLITGISGSGKSALLANWWKQHTNEVQPMFIHFVGASSIASDFQAMILRLLEYINNIVKDQGGEPLILPKDESEITQNILQFFHAVSQKKGVTIVIDAINQLPEKYHNLSWLPDTLPPLVNVIISSIQGFISADSMRAKNFKVLDVLPLNLNEKELIINSKLCLYGKSISTENMTKLLQHVLSHIPLFLQTVLSEMCIIGYYDKFQSQLDALLASADLPALFTAVILRWEESFGHETVRSILLLILCSRFGIEESHLLQITKATPLVFFPCMSAIRPTLTIYNGCFNFGHDYLRHAVLKQYSTGMLETYSKLAEFWASRPFDKTAAFVYPWLLSQIVHHTTDPIVVEHTNNQLFECLTPLEHYIVFEKPATLQYELLKYWSYLTSFDATKYQMANSYEERAMHHLATSFNEQTSVDLLDGIAYLLASLNYNNQAHSILLTTYNKLQLPNDLSMCSKQVLSLIRSLGKTYVELDNIPKAMELYMQGIQICKVQQNEKLLGKFHTEVGVAMLYTDPTTALEHFTITLMIHKKLYGDLHIEIGACYNNIGEARRMQGNLLLASDNLKHALHIFHKLVGDCHEFVGNVLHNLGWVEHKQNNNAQALEYWQKSLDIYCKLFGKMHYKVATVHNLIGTLQMEEKKFTEATDHLICALNVFTILYGRDHSESLKVAAELENLRAKQNAFD